jgi:hypothetical protein
VVGFLHYQPSRPNWVLHCPNAGHGASGAVATIHDGSIHFLVAFMGKHRPAPRVEERIVFKTTHSYFHRIEGGASLAQHSVAGVEAGLQGCLVGQLLFRSHESG